jgi:hypothetical protein
MKKTETEMALETLQRVVRIETRLMALGGKLGFDLKDDEDIAVDVERRVVTLQTLDVPYTSVIRKCRQQGLHGQHVVVYWNDKLIAEMPV